MDVDVSGVSVPDVKIARLEKDLFTMDPAAVDARTQELLERYGEFYVSFVTQIINNGGLKDTSYNDNLARFISDKDMREAYGECMKAYPDLGEIEEQITDVFRHYKYYFPERKTPEVFTYMSGFNYSISTSGGAVGIGLEMYLGPGNKFYRMLEYPQYRTRTMDRNYIVPDFVKGWASSMFEEPRGKDDLLTKMVHMGRIYYFMDAMLPQLHDTLKIGYSEKQLNWCRINEYNMWAYFIQNKLLYTTDHMEINKFAGEGPFTAAFNKEAPSRVAHWLGWQIVKAYMEKNPKTSILQLMQEKDAQKILTGSKYKPEK